MYSVNSNLGTSARVHPNTLASTVSRWLNIPIVTWVGAFSIFAVGLGNLIDIEADNDSVDFDGQAAVKVMFLAIAGLYGGIGFLSDPKVRKLLFTFPVMWMFILLGFYCLSVPTSSVVVQSLASTISVACVLLMTVTALVQLGPKVVLKILFFTTACYVFGSWIAYLFFPSVGVFLEATTDGEFVPRMGGLAHPNTLGQISGMTLVLGLLLYREEKNWSWMRSIVILAAAAALIGSLSRTSLLATTVAVMVVFRGHLFQRKYALLAIAIFIMGIVALMAASMFTDIESKIGSKLGMLSKSGDASELTSATGRTEIWGKAIELISKEPLFGYGAATSKFLLKDFSMHTHNLVLNVAFSTGIIGGFVALCMCLGRFFRLFVERHPIADALVVFILVNGLFENVIFSILCGLPTILWTVGLALPALEKINKEAEGTQIDHPILRVSAS